MTGAYRGEEHHEISDALSARLAGGRAKSPIRFGISSEPGHWGTGHRSPSTSVPTEASGCRSIVRPELEDRGAMRGAARPAFRCAPCAASPRFEIKFLVRLPPNFVDGTAEKIGIVRAKRRWLSLRRS
jgi:hypothetical protein